MDVMFCVLMMHFIAINICEVNYYENIVELINWHICLFTAIKVSQVKYTFFLYGAYLFQP